MDWQEIGPHKDAVIWVRKVRAGYWLAGVTPLPLPPASMPGFATPSGEMVLPEGFKSRAAAVKAATQYINREHELTVGGQESPAGELRPQPTRRGVSRRQFARIPVSLPVIGQAPQFREMVLRGMVRSVGPGGLMVEFPVVVVRDSVLRLALQTGLGPLEVEGRVMWTAATGNIVRHGLAFPEPKSPDFADGLDIGRS